jgi:hypothetical protein
LISVSDFPKTRHEYAEWRIGEGPFDGKPRSPHPFMGGSESRYVSGCLEPGSGYVFDLVIVMII